MKTKKCVLTFLILLSCGYSTRAQPPAIATTPEKPKTELQAFQERHGVVIVQGYSRIPAIRGTGGTFQITVKEFRNAANSSKTKGLVVEVDTVERYASSARTFIDYSEIDSLLKGVEYVSKIDKSVTTLTHFEAQYRTKDDFSITVFNDSGGKLSVSLGVGSIGRKSIFLTIEQLADLTTGLQQAKAVLDAL